MTAPVALPGWIATLVGRLTLENEALRQALTEMQQSEPAPSNGHVPEPERVS